MKIKPVISMLLDKHMTKHKQSLYNKILSKAGACLAKYLTQPVRHYSYFSLENKEILESYLQPGDVLLVEGNERISTPIKYLTQSTWSHTAMYVGDYTDPKTGKTYQHQLVEADIVHGVIAVPVNKYSALNTRICQPVGLSKKDRQAVSSYMIKSIGMKYDLRNVIDLMRYLFPTPPVPSYFRRELLVFGSGDPTKAICSSLIAEAFQSIQYPILPSILESADHSKKVLQIRHHSLFVPRDFDISPYFNILKPELNKHFNHKNLQWSGVSDIDETPSQ